MNKAVSALGGLLVIGVAVVFIVQFQQVSPSAQQGGGSGPTCAVELQGGCIPTPHFTAAFRLIGSGAENPQYDLKDIVAEGLIERWLLNEDAKRLGITVSDDEVVAELAKGRAYVSLPADKERQMAFYTGLLAPQPGRALWETPMRTLQVKNPKTKRFETKTYEKTVRTIAKMSPIDFRDFQREEMIASRMRNLIRSRVHVAEAEGYEDFARRKSTATLGFVKLDRAFYADLFVDQSQKAIDEWTAKNTEDVKKAYEARKGQYEGECRVARHILAKFSEDASEADKAAAKKRIDKALELLNKGEDFADVARRFSQDGSANRGGELGCVPRKQTVEAFEKALYALDEGKVSPIITSEFGYHIIKNEKTAKSDAVASVVSAQLARDQYIGSSGDKLAAEAAKTIQAAVKGGKSLEDALKVHLEELAAKLAGEKKPEDKKADEKKPEEKKPDAPKDGDAKAAGDVEENKPVTLENHPDRPLVQATAPFNMSGNPIPEATSTADLVKQAFALQKPGDTTSDVVPTRDGYSVVQLKEKAPAKKEEWEKDREETLAAIRRTKRDEALVLYIQRLRSKIPSDSPIKKNPAVVTKPNVKTDADAPGGMDDEGEQ